MKNEILSYKNLKDNWDGYGAKPISNIVIKKAINFITNIDDEIKQNIIVYPHTDGGICIQFENKIIYLQISIYEDFNLKDNKILLNMLRKNNDTITN